MKGNKLKEVGDFLKMNYVEQKIINFEIIDSTNNYAKENAENLNHGTIILSQEQFAGKGRMGREWSSPKGTGIWMSIVLKPKILIKDATKITQIAAAATCKSIRELLGLEALIKWSNDIVIAGKKVAGILIEASSELNEIKYIIVGIGVNVNNVKFPEDLKEKATSLFIESCKGVDREKLTTKIVENFWELYNLYINDLNLEETLYLVRRYSAIIGKRIDLIQGKTIRKARAIDINDDGFLIVEIENGNTELISSGEVSIRGRKGYASFD